MNNSKSWLLYWSFLWTTSRSIILFIRSDHQETNPIIEMAYQWSKIEQNKTVIPIHSIQNISNAWVSVVSIKYVLFLRNRYRNSEKWWWGIFQHRSFTFSNSDLNLVKIREKKIMWSTADDWTKWCNWIFAICVSWNLVVRVGLWFFDVSSKLRRTRNGCRWV